MNTTDHMTDEERERVAGLRGAAGKLRTAAEALATLGLSDLNLYGRDASDVLALAVSQLDGEAAAIPQRAVPIKIGDAVRITRPWDRRSTPWTERLKGVGPKWITTDRGKYSRDNGCDGHNAYVDPIDLERIRRCFPAKGGRK